MKHSSLFFSPLWLFSKPINLLHFYICLYVYHFLHHRIFFLLSSSLSPSLSSWALLTHTHQSTYVHFLFHFLSPFHNHRLTIFVHITSLLITPSSPSPLSRKYPLTHLPAWPICTTCLAPPTCLTAPICLSLPADCSHLAPRCLCALSEAKQTSASI